VMYFNERSDLNQPKCKPSRNDSQLLPKEPLTYQFRGSDPQNVRARHNAIPLENSGRLGATDVLNTANNRLQELMQLLYLLSRDPAVPNDARYHVTVAQSEIALLVRIMRNAEDAALHRDPARPDANGMTTSPNL